MYILFAVFIAALAVQVFYHVFLFSRLAFYRPEKHIQKYSAKISVVICSKNEILGLQKLLPVLLKQKYPDFEILIVDDQSDDGSVDYISTLNDSRITIFTHYKKQAGKKELLIAGIEKAKGDFILCCDADCMPSSDLWISQMTQELVNNDIEIVLGYAPFYNSNRCINLIARYENFMTATFYLSFALASNPYMGVGRNLLFKKSLYQRYASIIMAIPTLSGDDDLFIQFAATSKNTSICIEPNAFVYSSAKNQWASFLQQKTRHISSGYYYTFFHKLALAAYPGSLLLMCVSFITILFFVPNMRIISFIMLVLYLTLALLIKTWCMNKLHFKSKILVLFLDILFLGYQLAIHPLYLIKKKNAW